MQIHGWNVEVSERARDGIVTKQQVVLRKGDDFVLTLSAPGVDQEILIQRALIEALRKDLAAAKGTDVPLARQQLNRAIIEEKVLMMERNPVPDGEEVV